MDKEKMGPKYKQIKEDIVEDILSGVYEPGDMIPKQSDYALKYNVSRLTVRKAIDDLVLKGVLQTEKGKGTFVQEIATKAYSYRRVVGFSSNIVSKKIHPKSKVISIKEDYADKSLASHLKIKEGEVVVEIARLRYINDICTSFQKSYFAKKRVAGIDFNAENLNENSLYDVLFKRASITMSLADERFRAVRATEEIAGYFGVEEGDPILYVTRVTYDSNHVPIEYCRNYESSDVNGIWVKSMSI
jgi:GntR family transcriptional regulator